MKPRHAATLVLVGWYLMADTSAFAEKSASLPPIPSCLSTVASGSLVAFNRGRSDVTLKIEKTVHRRRATVRLIGRVRAEDLPELARQLEGSGPGAALQLDEVTLVDVDVVRFLNRCETEGVRLVHCSPHIREWMSREQNRSQR
jgi:hypothetical protein